MAFAQYSVTQEYSVKTAHCLVINIQHGNSTKAGRVREIGVTACVPRMVVTLKQWIVCHVINIQIYIAQTYHRH